ncbi:hypothetical protein [Microbacterium sp.]|jgi:hypothetical protein|uniref:hypothetical protein n=1 Tax=Microbacterium sp. TaxID=51671 RepID=UPI002BC0EE4A|nr:hypothetical protein [Microbacterium sp.]HWL78137.1 hypothetical protein [Microbacterium sp.]
MDQGLVIESLVIKALVDHHLRTREDEDAWRAHAARHERRRLRRLRRRSRVKRS